MRNFVTSLIVIALLSGCGTTTQRLATEQLLISEAVDTAISQIDFRSLSGRKVYLDTSFLGQVKSVGFVNSDYIISSLRQQLTAARCLLQENRDDADIIVEARVGALGTDGHEVTYGLPQTGAMTSAAAILTSTPVAAPLPELSVGRSDAQQGVAKIVAFAYDRETRQPLWQSGIAKAESSSKNTWLLGAGPFQRGSIYEGVQFAGTVIKADKKKPESQTQAGQVDYAKSYLFPMQGTKDIETTPIESSRVAEEPGDTKLK